MQQRLFALAAVVAATVLFVPACSSSGGSASSATGPTSKELGISGVWAREVMGNGVLYMTITGGAEADALTSVEVPSGVAGMAHLHQTVMGDPSTTSEGGSTDSSGAMTMQQVEKIEVPAGKIVQLRPGGYHIMLMDVKRDLTAGDTFPVTLTFEKAGTKKVAASVKGV